MAAVILSIVLIYFCFHLRFSKHFCQQYTVLQVGCSGICIDLYQIYLCVLIKCLFLCTGEQASNKPVSMICTLKLHIQITVLPVVIVASSNVPIQKRKKAVKQGRLGISVNQMVAGLRSSYGISFGIFLLSPTIASLKRLQDLVSCRLSAVVL